MEAKELLEKHFGSDLLNAIITKTFARHSLLSEEDYVKELGFEGKSEGEVFRTAVANLLIESTNQLIQTKNSIIFARELLKNTLVEKED